MPENKDVSLSFRVELSIKCPECHKPVPLDGPMEIVQCESCDTDIPFTREYWVETLSEAHSKMRSVKIGQGTASMILGAFAANLSLARFYPYCDQCKTDFSPSWKNSVGGDYTCGSCGVKYPVNSPPSWLRKGIPGMQFLVNALLEVQSSKELSSSTSPVVLACPSCSASLDVDGSTRFVDCSYCNSQVYLPDDLWMKFHKVKQKRRWFVVSR